MAIEWREQLSIDNGVIDADHRHLIDIVNRFEALSESFDDVSQALEILMSMRLYTKIHFEREEHLQRVSGYRFADAHRREHADLIRQLETVVARAQDCDLRDLPRLSRETALLLRDWLVGHIIKSDLRMKPYVAAMDETAKGMTRLDKVDTGAMEIDWS
ncbi:MAG: hemerythrin family protein [Hyphomicrobiales bacterium]|nr:hemerythrin family protein [Hyphomicrobiales bacterium]MCP5372711.1 hemerythrin family protein [Hyphomicrobiales bacterium]